MCGYNTNSLKLLLRQQQCQSQTSWGRLYVSLLFRLSSTQAISIQYLALTTSFHWALLNLYHKKTKDLLLCTLKFFIRNPLFS